MRHLHFFLIPDPRILQLLMLGYLGFGSPPVIIKALVGLKERRPDLGLLVLMAVGGALALHDVLDAVLVSGSEGFLIRRCDVYFLIFLSNV